MPSLKQTLTILAVVALGLVVLPMVPVIQDLPGVKKLK